jgi:hypothetical protein
MEGHMDKSINRNQRWNDFAKGHCHKSLFQPTGRVAFSLNETINRLSDDDYERLLEMRPLVLSPNDKITLTCLIPRAELDGRTIVYLGPLLSEASNLDIERTIAVDLAAMVLGFTPESHDAEARPRYAKSDYAAICEKIKEWGLQEEKQPERQQARA